MRWGGINRRAMAVALLVTAAAHAELVDKVAAVVNRDIIPLSEVNAKAAMELSRTQGEPDGKKRNELRQQILMKALDQLIGERLLDQQAKDLNVEVSEAQIDAGIDDVKKQNKIDGEQFEKLLLNEGYTLASYRAFMKKHMARMTLINLKVRAKVKVSDEDVKAEYARYAKAESDDVEVHVRHLLVQLPAGASPAQVEDARKKAAGLAAEARAPGVDFAKLARAKSEGASKDEGGDLGFFRRGVMVPEFEKVAFNAPLGTISDPVRTSLGWHVLKIEEKRALPAKGFEEMKEALREQLFRAQLEKFSEQYVQELRGQAVIALKM